MTSCIAYTLKLLLEKTSLSWPNVIEARFVVFCTSTHVEQSELRMLLCEMLHNFYGRPGDMEVNGVCGGLLHCAKVSIMSTLVLSPTAV